MRKNTCGFTLIEMSIVLVIIGLIVGAVMTGQSLIRQSQINSAVSDEQRYVQAVANFQQKYGALPGDFATATTYWGAGGTCPATNGSPLSPPVTCNGDGNGQVGTTGSGGTYSTTSAQAYSERLLFWEHLVDASFTSGKYNGSPGSAGTQDSTLGTNVPLSRVDGAGFGVNWVGITSGNADYFDNSYGHVFIFGGYSSNFLPIGKIVTPAEAYGIDSKFDDGLPATGNILTWKSTGSYDTTCATTGVSSTAAYATTAGFQCSLIFITGF